MMVFIAAEIDTARAISLCLAKSYYVGIKVSLLFHVARLQSDMRNLLDIHNRHEGPPYPVLASIDAQAAVDHNTRTIDILRPVQAQKDHQVSHLVHLNPAPSQTPLLLATINQIPLA